MSLAPVDLVVLLVYLCGVVAFGAWMGRHAGSVTDYVVAGRDRPWWLILASIIATETSTITFLSIPGFAFGRDLTWLQIAAGFAVGRLLVAWLLLPRFFSGSLLSAYEVLQERFGHGVQKAASALFVLTRSLADGLRLFLTAVVLEEMTGLPLPWAALVIGVATVAYTFGGGMRAVLWTDLVQLALYLSGAAVTLAIIIERLPGGFEQMMAIGDAAGRLRAIDLTLDWSEPYGLLAGLVGGAVVAIGTHGTDQLMVQRYLSARGLGDARKALVWNSLLVFGQFAFFLLIGVGLFAFYEVYPPAEAFERTDRVFVRFILDELPRGVVGLLLGGVFAAAMSTLSSSLNACAASAATDLGIGGRDPARRLARIRWLTVVFAAVQVAVGIGGQWLSGAVVSSVLGISAFVTGIVLGLFALGIITQRVGQRAALIGLVIGAALMTAIFFFTPLAWPWYALVGSTLTFLAGVGASCFIDEPEAAR